MADTAKLLPSLPMSSSLPAPRARSTSPLSGIPQPSDSIGIPSHAQIVHYPVLVPNMRGLDNLLKLENEWRDQGRERRLTDEIAVFVSATEVRHRT